MLNLLKTSNFLKTPEIDVDSVEFSNGNTLETILELLKTPSYNHFIHIADISKLLISSFDITKENKLSYLFNLWEIRLVSLLFADELSIAQGEAEKLTESINEILIKLRELKTTDNEFSTIDKYSKFPNEVPLSLRLLIIRLRSVGPGKLVNEEYFKQIWNIRSQYIKNHLEIQVTNTFLKSSYFGLSSSLIAKRKYFTYLTNANNLIESKKNDKDDFYNQVLFLNSLINLLIGEIDNASSQYNSIDKQSLIKILNTLETVLNSINPIVDKTHRDSISKIQPLINQEDSKDNIDLHSTDISIDDLFDLVKNQLITGRILCSLCALFEIDIRYNSDDLDVLNINEVDETLKQIQKTISGLWRNKPYKLYTFE